MDDTWEDRQDNERAALKAIYGEQMQELVPKNEASWTPLECILRLGPDGVMIGSKPTSTVPFVDLHITCPVNYPQALPAIKLENWKKISNDNIALLQQELVVLADQLQGEVMIFELAQYIEKFLHTYNQPGFESFYEEMVTRNRDQLEKELQKRKAEEEKKKEEIRLEIHVKEQAVKKALRRRQNSVKSLEDDFVKLPFLDDRDEKTKLFTDITGEVDGQKEDGQEEYTPWKISEKGQSRFENEFEHINWLGKGAFGDVIKVRNKLDDGLYAIKRIELNPSEKQLNKKITREVKLLSRLNHENVVRYYNSWIESADVKSLDTNRSKSPVSKNVNNLALEMLPHNDPSFEWNVDETNSNSDESSDEWVMFQSTASNENFEGNAEDNTDTDNESLSLKILKVPLQYMYIQMELCDKSTLRIAIDNDLFRDGHRVWRLFREIVEGLCHIHQQGIIHRDLKPVNIFIGHDDHVKIGDFGLATTIVLQKQNPRELTHSQDPSEKSEYQVPLSNRTDISHTGQVGTTLYVAPELNNYISRFCYNQKVDIYSLGVIFFEMCFPPMKTAMERYQILTELRQPKPVFPQDLMYEENSQQLRLIRWMLQYDVELRPSSQQLLQSHYIPPPKMEEAEVKEMVRRTLSNPQSRDYKYLISSCFNQPIQSSLDATYNISSWRSTIFTSSLDVVANKLKAVFQRHGATSFLPPLLTPDSQPLDTAVGLMTRMGSIVYATQDLQTPFARYLAHNSNVTQIKRYALDKIYRERPAGVHPKENYECSFDVVTPNLGDMMPEYEMMCVIWEILNEFSSILGRNCIINLNHSALVSAMLKHCGLDEIKQRETCIGIFKKRNFYQTKQDLEGYLKILGLPERTLPLLMQWMEIEGPLKKVASIIKDILKSDNIIASCKKGFEQLEAVVGFCETIGISCPVVITMSHLKNAHYYSGVMLQLSFNQRNHTKQNEPTILLSGGRYDKLVQHLKETLPRDNGKCHQFVLGFTLCVDKLIYSLEDQNKCSSIDVLVCGIGKVTMSHDKLLLLRDLWKFEVRTAYLNSMETLEEIQSNCRDLGIPIIVIFKETEIGYARIRTLTKDRFYEKKVPNCDLLEYIFKKKSQLNMSTMSAKSELKCQSTTDGPVITFVTADNKLTHGAKRRYESQILNNLSALLQKFASRARVEVIAATIEGEILKTLAYIIDSASTEQDMGVLYRKYPRQKKYIQKIIDHIEEAKHSAHSSINIVYSLQDNIYKVLL